LWNRYRFAALECRGRRRYQDEVYTAISNAVTLPSLVRFDAALFFDMNDRLDAQINVENLLNEKYYETANGDNNITPGTTRVVRATVTTRLRRSRIRSE
jgi:catecholate siderophore receptor